MLKDIVKLLPIAILGLAGAVAGCAGNAPTAPLVPALAQSRNASRPDSVVPACAYLSCRTVNVIAPLEGGANEVGMVYLSASKSWQPTPMTLKMNRPLTLGKMTLALAQSCGADCGVIVSQQPLESGNADAAIVEGPLSQRGATLTLETQRFELPAGTYYFYVATIGT